MSQGRDNEGVVDAPSPFGEAEATQHPEDHGMRGAGIAEEDREIAE